MRPQNKRTIPTRSSRAIILTALVITASSTGRRHRVEALKLTSLGSTLESNVGSKDALLADLGDSVLSGIDYSSLKCSAPKGGEAAPSSSSSSLATCSSTYGVDRSFPIHHVASALTATNNDDLPINWPDKKSLYKEFMEGCHRKYDAYLCDGSERERMEMNFRQPASMYNYTTLGFHKVKAPKAMMSLLSKFWHKKTKLTYRASVANIPNETWDMGNTYTNHWASPTKMLSVISSLRKSIWDASKPLLEEWAGVELSPTSLYGVRVYTEGAVLAPHVDRTPLVISAIVNVDQDVDEPWPLEVYGHDGNAYNITMEVGDMIFYESHTVIHGRPFPLKGRHYANVFIHFEPLGHSLQHHEQNAEDEESLEYLYKQAWKKLQSKCQDDEECASREDLNVVPKVPPYIVPGSQEEMRWMQTHPKAKLDAGKDNEMVKTLSAHTAASTGDLEALIAIAIDNPDALKHKDNNGWNPLHEAVRGGHVEIVKFLLKGGLDKNERTHTGNGGSPLWWAKKTHGLDHPMVKYLESIGAEEVPPEGHKKIVKE